MCFRFWDDSNNSLIKGFFKCDKGAALARAFLENLETAKCAPRAMIVLPIWVEGTCKTNAFLKIELYFYFYTL